MVSKSTQVSDAEFTPVGVIRVSASALNLARELGQAIRHSRREDWVIVFDWATSVAVRRGPNEPSERIADCVMVGASERKEVPSDVVQSIDGVEFAIQIPRHVWEKASKRLIDTDESLLFKLTLL